MKSLPLVFAFSFLSIVSAPAKDAAARQPVSAESAAMAPPMPPEPPHHNPHEAQTAEDKRRVDFAVREVVAYYGPEVELRHPHIIPWSFQNFLNNRQNAAQPTQQNSNVIVEAQSKQEPMPPSAGASMTTGPALQPDEYMVHIYAKFKGDPAWYHLDVILTEDAAGNPVRRRFFRIPMPPAYGKLPPGVVC